MSPRELDAGVVQARLTLIRGLLDDLHSVGEVTVDLLQQDRMLRHGVERVLGQLVELAVSINGHVGATLLGRAPADYRTSFALAQEAGALEPELVTRLQASVGLRNVLTHEYVDIDLGIVAVAVTSAGQDYGQYVQQMARWIAGRQA
ncbi:MAG: type VII toxin-antitoxin system HepT family RNase toxin [Dermatophilaceae bacterium]